MNGFAPLIEGFLAFALTMLALTTGVSAIVGALNHLRRRHARGLRDMVRVLYVRDLKPLVDGDSDGTEREKANVASALTAPPKSVREAVKSEFLALGTRLARLFKAQPPLTDVQKTKADTDATEIARRALFIFDMTFMPVPDVVEKIQRDGRLHWLTKLASAERLCGMPWYTTVFHPKRLARRWKTLRCGLAELTDAEFLDRLARSDLGSTLKSRTFPVGAFQRWEDLAAHLLGRFKTIGGASSETFARHARGWSVVVGFLLAAILNIDSIDLLNSYLTNPQLRQSVVAQSDEILRQQTPAPDSQAASPLAPARVRVNEAANQLSATLNALTGALPTLKAVAGSGDGQKAVEAVQAGLTGLLAQVKGVQEGVGALDEDVTRAQQQILGVTRSLTASFPIGWDRFPNCRTPNTPDLRCGEPRVAGDASAWQTLSTMRTAKPAEFYQWLVGVFLTTVLLGLGSPFWVQVVSGALKLSRAAQGDAAKQKAQTAQGTASAP
jgi:hypothetical protein